MELHLYKTVTLIPDTATPEELNRWAKLLVRSVDRDSWQNFGGAGWVQIVKGTAPQAVKPWVFVISQTAANHVQIKAILLGLDQNIVVV